MGVMQRTTQRIALLSRPLIPAWLLTSGEYSRMIRRGSHSRVIIGGVAYLRSIA